MPKHIKRAYNDIGLTKDIIKEWIKTLDNLTTFEKGGRTLVKVGTYECGIGEPFVLTDTKFDGTPLQDSDRIVSAFNTFLNLMGEKPKKSLTRFCKEYYD